jgi:hypothetical protein
MSSGIPLNRDTANAPLGFGTFDVNNSSQSPSEAFYLPNLPDPSARPDHFDVELLYHVMVQVHWLGLYVVRGQQLEVWLKCNQGLALVQVLQIGELQERLLKGAGGVGIVAGQIRGLNINIQSAVFSYYRMRW